LFEITPEIDQRRLSGVRCYQGFQAVVRESHRENLNWQVLVILVVDQDGKPINLFDPFIRDGNAADRGAIAMKKNVATRILMCAEDAVGSIRITDVQAEEEIALWIEPIQFVEALRHLFVSEAALGPQSSRRGANPIFVHEHESFIFP